MHLEKVSIDEAVSGRSLFIGPENYFGPSSGLGSLEYSSQGPTRKIGGSRLCIPVDVSAVREVQLDISVDGGVKQVSVWFPSSAERSIRFDVTSAGPMHLPVPFQDVKNARDMPDVTLRVETVPESCAVHFNGLTLYLR